LYVRHGRGVRTEDRPRPRSLDALIDPLVTAINPTLI
jgi:hypothetical protein